MAKTRTITLSTLENLTTYFFPFCSARRNSKIILFAIPGFSDSKKCVVPGMTDSCASLIDLNNSRVCSGIVASRSPTINNVGAAIFASSSFLISGSVNQSFFVFSKKKSGSVRDHQGLPGRID
jgi:hypothetical protein